MTSFGCITLIIIDMTLQIVSFDSPRNSLFKSIFRIKKRRISQDITFLNLRVKKYVKNFKTLIERNYSLNILVNS